MRTAPGQAVAIGGEGRGYPVKHKVATREEWLAEVIAGWRATARIKADESLYPQALAPTQGDFGRVQALG
jgi:hypothetical protein